MINLYNDDCINVLKKLLNEQGIKVDAVITDPPYNISKDNNFKSMGRAGIDFGEWDKGFDLTSWIKRSSALLKKGGSSIIFNSTLNLGVIAQELEAQAHEVKDCLRWVKNNPMPRNMNRRYVSDYEMAVWAVKNGGKWTFNNTTGSYLRPEFRLPLTPAAEKSLGKHPTQKSLELMKQLILIHTNEGDTILDPFMGSGTTGVAAAMLGRNFIGVELAPEYFELASKRIAQYE